uniref:C2H2-type domain-containing protein n=1 Tax=Timema monikensis TaxID=170555 RepID=A0A7R9HJB5_9NEOP|nr:unnamed protein product [Timema monikensis]
MQAKVSVSFNLVAGDAMELCGACAVLGLLVVPCLSARILFLHPLYSGSHEVQLRGLAEHLATARGHHITYVKFANTVDIPNNHPNISLITLTVDNRDGRHPYISRELQGRFDMPLDVLWEHGHLPHKIPPDAFSTVIIEYCKLHSPVLKDSTYLKERSETLVRLSICHFLICPRKLTRGLPYAQVHAGRLQVCHKAGVRTMIALCDTLLGDSELLTRLKRQNIRLAVIDLFTNECGLAFAYQLGIPLVGYWALPLNGGEADYAAGMALTSFSPISPSFMSGLTDDMNFYQRMKNALYKLLGTIVMRLQMFITNNLIQKYFPGTPHPTLLLSNLSGVLANVDHSLDYPRPLPPNVIPVGCMQCRPARRLPEIMELFVRGSGEAGVILFSLGATFDPSWVPKETLKRFLKTFSHLEQRVIVKYHGEIDMEVPENVMIVSWLPQQDILGHPQTRVFFSHCGKQSAMEAVYHEVPIVAMPVFGDQIDVAGMLRAKGMGVVVDKQAPEEEIIHALNEVIYNYSYTKNVRKWRGVMLDQPQTARERAVWFLEHVIRHGGATHLTMAATNCTIMEKRSFIVIGEAPESESEEEEVNIVDAPRGTHTTNPQGIIVAGEAPESDEEREGTATCNIECVVDAVNVPSVSSAANVSSIPLQTPSTNVATKSPGTESGKPFRKNISSSHLTTLEHPITCNPVQSDVLDHMAIHEGERNMSLHKNLLEFVHLSVSGPVRDLNTANHQLLQSQITLQEAATTLHTLHKSLTLLSSRLSDITSINLNAYDIETRNFHFSEAVGLDGIKLSLVWANEELLDSVAEPSNISNNSSQEIISYGDKLCPQDKINYLESKLQIEKEKSDKITSDWFDFSVNSNTSYAGDEKHLSCNNGEVESNCAVSANDTVLKLFSKSQKLPGKTHSSPLAKKLIPAECGKMFVKRSSLKVHLATHTKNKPFICEVCGQGFSQKVSRDIHLVRHTGKYNYKCIKCDKSFPCRSKLNAHSYIHKTPQFACSVCCKKFVHRDTLQTHLLIHADKKLHQCSECHRGFTTKSNLRQHEQSHSNLLFSCEHCGAKFRYQSSLTSHRRCHQVFGSLHQKEILKHTRYDTKFNILNMDHGKNLDLSSDEECDFDGGLSTSSHSKRVRLGADKINRGEVDEDEVQPTSSRLDGDEGNPNNDDSNVDEPEIVTNNEINYFLTEKKDIKWRHRPISILNSDQWQPDTKEEIKLTPLMYFRKYIPEHLFEAMAEMTNMYAIQAATNSFKPTTTAELETLFGLHLVMGTLKFPRVRMYWDTTLKMDLFLNSMSRDRFFQLRTNLHLVDNMRIPPDNKDKFFKVRPIYDSVRNRCLELHVEEYLAVDEAMIPFTGHLSVKQFVQGKPTPWGIKMYMLCGKSGLAYDFLLYQGATTEFKEPLLRSFGQGPTVVLQLAQRISEGKGYKLFFDNFFSTYKLFQALKQDNIFAAGTVRVNRMRLADALVLGGRIVTNKKRGRPSATPPQLPVPKRRGEVRPSEDVQYDGIEHFPIHTSAELPGRCKFPQCKGRSRVNTVMAIQERFLCPVCGKEFQRKHSLKTHEKCHRELSEGEVHLCHLCPNKYTQKSKLTQHLKTHLQEPQFCCEVCKKCFYRKDVYVKHMTTHSDQRPYCCAHCGKAFTFKSNLTAHLAMHPLPGQPIQMFRCLDCGREFRHKSSYTVHRKFHLGQFSHSCPTCGKQFTQKSRLASHIHCHSTDRPFVCPTCGRAYKEHKHRREHIKRAHPQEFSVESLLASITGDDTNVLGTEQQPLDGEHSLVTITNQSACIQDHLVNHLLAFPSVDHQTILEQNEQSELVVPFSVVQDECSLLVLSPNVAMYPPVDLETTLQDIQPTQFSTSPGDAMHCQGPLAILSGEDTTSVLSQGMT